MDEKLEKAKEFFKNDIFASEQTGIEIVGVSEGYAKCSLNVTDKHKNAVGHVMGGVIFTMADYAFAIASNFEQPTTVTQTSQIIYLASPKGDVLYAEAQRIKSGKKTCVYKIVVSDNTGADIAYVTATGIIIGA